MKNTFKKVAAVVLAVLMCVSAMVPTFAASTCPGASVLHTAANCTSYKDVTVQEPTCTVPGAKTAICTTCSAVVQLETIPTVAHAWDAPAACLESKVAGQLPVRTCGTCGKTETYVPADHTWTAWSFVSSNVKACAVNEKIARQCTVCKKEVEETIGAEGHYFMLEAYTAPASCVVDGVAKYICVIKGCGATKTQVIEAGDDAAHTYVSWNEYYKDLTVKPVDTAAKAASCSADGAMTVVCKDCGRTAVISVPKTNAHTWNTAITKYTAQTCEKAGNYAYTYCVYCRVLGYDASLKTSTAASVTSTAGFTAIDEKFYAENVVIPSFHEAYTVYGEDLPTCDRDGFRLVKCSNTTDCGWTSQVTLKAMGAHVYYPDVAASDKETQKTIMEKLGITTAWADLDNFVTTGATADQQKVWKNYVARDCEKDATVEWKCLNCAVAEKVGETNKQCVEFKKATPEGADFVKTGHKYNSAPDAATDNFPAATCTTDGVEKYTCTLCGKYNTPTIVKALGHKLVVDTVESAKYPVTCKQAGKIVYKCIRATGCDVSEYTEEVAASNEYHKWEYLSDDGQSWTTTSPATCEKDVVVTRKCTEAGCGVLETGAVIKATGHKYLDVADAGYAKLLSELKEGEKLIYANGIVVKGTTTREPLAQCTQLGNCEQSSKYVINCENCAMFKYHEVKDGFNIGHKKVYLNGTATAATCTTPEYSNYWYCTNAICTNFAKSAADAWAAYEALTVRPTAVGATANTVTLARDEVSAPNHKLWDAEKKETKADAVTYKDVPYSAIKDAKTATDAAKVEAPVDAKGNVTRYVAVPGTSLIWIFKYTSEDHTVNSITSGGFYCTECTYTAATNAPAVVYAAKTTHTDATTNASGTLVAQTPVAPTCENYGYTLYACNEPGCFYAEQHNYKAPVDHNNTTSKHLDATCTLSGYTIETCQWCNKVTTTFLPALGHYSDLDDDGEISYTPNYVSPTGAVELLTESCLDRNTDRVCDRCGITVVIKHTGTPGAKCTLCTATVPTK